MSEIRTPVGKYPFFNRITSSVNSMMCYRFKGQHNKEGSVLTADPSPDQCGAVWAVANYEADIERLEKERDELTSVLDNLVEMYIANRGSDHEFICCITPKAASKMTYLERMKDKTWRAWDEARIVTSTLVEKSSASPAVYNNTFIGANACGHVTIDEVSTEMILKPLGFNDYLNRFQSMGFTAYFNAAILDDSHIVNLLSTKA